MKIIALPIFLGRVNIFLCHILSAQTRVMPRTLQVVLPKTKTDMRNTMKATTLESRFSKIKTMETEVEILNDSNLSCTGKWLNGDQIMRMLGISRRTLQNYRDTGILPYSVVGGKFFYSIGDMEEVMANNYVPVVK